MQPSRPKNLNNAQHTQCSMSIGIAKKRETRQSGYLGLLKQPERETVLVNDILYTVDINCLVLMYATGVISRNEFWHV